MTGFMALCTLAATAQDTLPNFNLQNLGQNRMRISWINPYQSCVQLNIQRSTDSLRNFRTILSVQSPELPQNGYIDTKPGNDKMFYRLFYVLDGGNYFFTKARKAAQGFESSPLPLETPNNPEAPRLIKIKFQDSVIAAVPYGQYKKFRDSIIYQTKDSLFAVNDAEVILKRYIPAPQVPQWRPSVYIFTNREGYVTVHLPDAKEKNYRVHIFDTDGKLLFKLNHIKDTELTLDKTDFMHSGWFTFDLFENEKVVEHNKFYIPKEF
ncbi:hypothetical protein DXN05_08170 [Deminuibacter soli]|uniref:Uncharacterized protein n=2 Tax=Deminuibacter soli TaxID=2291815 RepID=A0A3E1NLD3_9BACT|nr:hypothetical protein DXN05_08170 [Deminuibacter soli]